MQLKLTTVTVVSISCAVSRAMASDLPVPGGPATYKLPPTPASN
jgi:hypothetical protein